MLVRVNSRVADLPREYLQYQGRVLEVAVGDDEGTAIYKYVANGRTWVFYPSEVSLQAADVHYHPEAVP